MEAYLEARSRGASFLSGNEFMFVRLSHLNDRASTTMALSTLIVLVQSCRSYKGTFKGSNLATYSYII